MPHFKHIASTSILSLLISVSAHSNVSPDGIWSDIELRSMAKKEYSYRSINANTEDLVNQLRSAPLEGSSSNGLEFFLPLPNGKFERVSVFESPIMAPVLAAKFPDIKTYKVTGLDNLQISGRLDTSPEGFHGFLNTDQGVIYIEPESSYNQDASSESYRSFNKINFPASEHARKCSIEGHVHSDNPLQSLSQDFSESSYVENSTLRSSGTAVRTYRLALAATAEYTAAVSGGAPTVAKGQAAIVTAINRINQIYEKEVAIKFQLINDNEKIVFTNSATDGYTNPDGIALLNQNQAKLDTEIGSANYDIGHVFSTGGGGVAALGSACDLPRKAMGVTGLPNPVGDPFVVDFVAHEIGHQFGAPHTFNGGGNTSGGCDDHNRQSHTDGNGRTELAASAYEPGSGSTIMGYAGTCGQQDLQSNTDAYFHARSLEQIRNFVENRVPYGNIKGGNCGIEAPTNNTPPSAEAGNNYTIPANTPFALTGEGSDVDAADVASLNYTWEQYDLGSKSTTQAQMHTDADTRPIIRSREGTSSPTRYIPALDAILENNLTKHTGERLPTTDRDMKFRLTVRSGENGFNQDDMTVTVNRSAGPLVVRTPASGSSLTGGQTLITWDVANTHLPPVNCANMSILYSTNGGTSFDTVIEEATPNDGSQVVNLPNTTIAQGRIKVQCVNNIFFNVSPGNFSVTKTALLAISPSSIEKIEGSSIETSYAFTVTRSEITTGVASVSYAVTGTGDHPADATDFLDNSLPSGVINFADGETSKTITVKVSGDTEVESDERFEVTLSNPISANIAKATATGIIKNDDSSLSITAISAAKNEGNAGNTAFTFNVTRTGILSNLININYKVFKANIGNNIAAESSDFAGNIYPSGSLTFAEGESSKLITVNVLGDTNFEPNESFSVTITGSSLILEGVSSANGIIRNDDSEPKPDPTPDPTPDPAPEPASSTSSGGGGGGSAGLLFVLLLPLLFMRRKFA